MTQREEFEKFWMKHCNENHLYCNLFRNSLDMYIDTYAEYAFKGWKEAKAHAVPQWIPVSERLPEERSNAYQVAATCLKKYEGGNYDGQGKKTIVQDWVIRRWPQNFISWFELPSAPEQNK